MHYHTPYLALFFLPFFKILRIAMTSRLALNWRSFCFSLQSSWGWKGFFFSFFFLWSWLRFSNGPVQVHLLVSPSQGLRERCSNETIKIYTLWGVHIHRMESLGFSKQKFQLQQNYLAKSLNCRGWVQTCNPLTSACQCTGITGLSYHTQLCIQFFFVKYISIKSKWKI